MPDLTELVEVKPDEPFILHPGIRAGLDAGTRGSPTIWWPG
jgi:hypothetical protein